MVYALIIFLFCCLLMPLQMLFICFFQCCVFYQKFSCLAAQRITHSLAPVLYILQKNIQSRYCIYKIYIFVSVRCFNAISIVFYWFCCTCALLCLYQQTKTLRCSTDQNSLQLCSDFTTKTYNFTHFWLIFLKLLIKKNDFMIFNQSAYFDHRFKIPVFSIFPKTCAMNTTYSTIIHMNFLSAFHY